jgi:hypothetical protein
MVPCLDTDTQGNPLLPSLTNLAEHWPLTKAAAIRAMPQISVGKHWVVRGNQVATVILDGGNM